ncbi:hypothetical protein T02_3236 [Trichinella nativa]|uniref:Uncharacterized protein n=1 Tax=Trichinella nativa TaxID=6335 RepID=A0A0V1KMF7_9BILA|nr:hypothetical protein T02_3236 [Trichinella nativa]
MEEAIDTADKATSNQGNGNEQTILSYALQSTTQKKNTPFLYKKSRTALEHTIQEYQTGKLRQTASLPLVQSVVHYKDIPEKETAPMQYFNKLEFR